MHGPATKSKRQRHSPAEARARLGTPRSIRRNAGPEVLGPPTGTYYAIAGVVAVFVMLGLVMVLSASAVTEANLGNSPYRIFSRQAMWAGIGLVGLVIAAKIPYTKWRRLIIPLGLLGVFAMCLPFVPGLGASINGASSWIRVGGMSVQPSEFLKLAVVVLAADLLARRPDDVVDARRAIVPITLVAGIGAGLCLAQGDLGSAVVLSAIVFSVAWIAGVPSPIWSRCAPVVPPWRCSSWCRAHGDWHASPRSPTSPRRRTTWRTRSTRAT